jgi:hypothetical protein
MSEYYDDPYSFNYATQIKGPKITTGEKTNPRTAPPSTRNFNVFNPNRVPKENKENNEFNQESNERNRNLNKVQVKDNNNNNNFDDLQGNIDLDKNVYDEKTKEFKNETNDFEEELPLLEGIILMIKLNFIKLYF